MSLATEVDVLVSGGGLPSESVLVRISPDMLVSANTVMESETFADAAAAIGTYPYVRRFAAKRWTVCDPAEDGNPERRVCVRASLRLPVGEDVEGGGGGG